MADDQPRPHLEALIEERLERKRRREFEEYQRGFKAMMLAPTLELYHALLRGEAVPVEMLRLKGVMRYGIRKS